MKFHLLLLLLTCYWQQYNTTWVPNAGQFEDSRDKNVYPYVPIGELYWFQENLRYKTSSSMTLPADDPSETDLCGQFYSVEDAFRVCPEGWRLPTEKETKNLVKADKKGKINLIDTLQIELCGRIDYGKISKIGEQNTFWIFSELTDGYITHWHTFGQNQELHNHNVVEARRQFPVRCVCEVGKLPTQ